MGVRRDRQREGERYGGTDPRGKEKWREGRREEGRRKGGR